MMVVGVEKTSAEMPSRRHTTITASSSRLAGVP
jgi:hypothetical protein